MRRGSEVPRGLSLLWVWVFLLVGGVCVAADKPNIVVEDNLIAGNGLGIYLGWEGDWYIAILNNRIERNGEGIRIVNRKALIEGNLVADNVIGVRITTEHEEQIVTEVEWVTLRGNSFVGNELYDFQNLASITVDVQDNWWEPEESQATVSSCPLIPWIFPMPNVMSPLTLRVSPSITDFTREALSLSEHSVPGESPATSLWGTITLDVRDLWDWREVFPCWTITLRGSLVMGPVEYGNWLAQPADHGGER